MVKRFLFETRAGDLFLAALERWAGLAVVDLGEIEPSEVRIIGAQARASSANA